MLLGWSTQQGGIDGGEVTGGGGLGANELGPSDSRSVGCGVDTVVLEDRPDRRGSDTVTEVTEFRADSPIAYVGLSVAMSMMSRRISTAMDGRLVAQHDDLKILRTA